MQAPTAMPVTEVDLQERPSAPSRQPAIHNSTSTSHFRESGGIQSSMESDEESEDMKQIQSENELDRAIDPSEAHGRAVSTGTSFGTRAGAKRPPPPPLRHNRSFSYDTHSAWTGSSNNSGSSVPSPLASPVTATANSLTSLSISHNSTSPYAFSGRDLSRITVPRERKARPYSIASGEAMLSQDYIQHHAGLCDGFQTGHSSLERLSDPDPSSSVSLSSPQPLDSTDSKRFGGMARDKEKQGSSGGSRSNDLRSPTLKPASQQRVNLFNLVSTGYLPANTLAVFREHSALVTEKGTLIPQATGTEPAALVPLLQNEYETPSAWATAMVKAGRTGKVAVNGWSAIKISINQDVSLQTMFAGQGMAEVSLDVLRKRYLADMTDDVSEATENGASGVDGTSYDRKKRKRPSARAAEKAALRIATQSESSSHGKDKARDQVRRPQRKRTLSDLSGMVTSDLFGNRQLHLEAAGALFAMQDSASTLSHRNKHRRPTALSLESVARHRQELASAAHSSCQPAIPTLRLFKALSMALLKNTSSCLSPSACGLCIPATMPNAVEGAGLAFEKYSPPAQQDIRNMVRCRDCKVEFHANCKLAEQPVLLDGSWTCVRCSFCAICLTSVHQLPNMESAKEKNTDESMDIDGAIPEEESPITLDGSALLPEWDQEQKLVAVLTCSQCKSLIHLDCQLKREPSLKEALHSNETSSPNSDLASSTPISWTCFSCRNCIECGYQIPTEVSKVDHPIDLEGNKIKQEPKLLSALSESIPIKPRHQQSAVGSTSVDRGCQGKKKTIDHHQHPQHGLVEGWSHDFSLCPSCTALSEKGNICPLCCRIYQDDDYETPMIFCDGCSLWVHVACDKGLEDRDYEELGEDSRQYFCPSCVPTPIPSPTCSSSSSVFSAFNSVEQSPWQGPMPNRPSGGGYPYSRQTSEFSREDTSSGNEADSWQMHSNRSYRLEDNSSNGGGSSSSNSRRKDDILDLIRAAREISDSEWSSTRLNSPSIGGSSGGANGAYSPIYPSASSSHSRAASQSLDSIAEVAAAEALLTIFSSGASTPISSTPYTSYPPSPYEPSVTGTFLPPAALATSHESRHYYPVHSPQDLPPLMSSMAVFTPSSDQESTTSASSSSFSSSAPTVPGGNHKDGFHRYGPPEDYFNRQSYTAPPELPPRGPVQYHQIGQELQLSPPVAFSPPFTASSTAGAVKGFADPAVNAKEILLDSEDIVMSEEEEEQGGANDKMSSQRPHSALGTALRSTLSTRGSPSLNTS